MSGAGPAPWFVLVPDRADETSVEAAVFGGRARLLALRAATPAAMTPHLPAVDAVLAWHELRYDEGFFRAARNLKVLVRIGVGYDNVDVEAAARAGVCVSNVPDYGTNDVADHALAFLLELGRAFTAYQRRLAAAPEENWRWGTFPTFRLTGRTLGIVGLGRIGAAVALRAKAFGIRVLFHDPYRERGWEKTLGVERVESLRDLAGCDVLSLHAPLTPETRGLIGADYWAAVAAERGPRGQHLVNTARGGLVDWPAFVDAFRAGIVPRAAFDVLPVEPLDRTDPLLAAWLARDPDVVDRLVLTPHCAFYSEEALLEMRRKAAEEALRVLEGRPPLYRVNAGRAAPPEGRRP